MRDRIAHTHRAGRLRTLRGEGHRSSGEAKRAKSGAKSKKPIGKQLVPLLNGFGT